MGELRTAVGHPTVENSESAIQRRPILRRDELDSGPKKLRQTLDELGGALQDCDPLVRRRILLAFGDLVAHWQYRFLGEPISAAVEYLPDAVRVTLQNSKRPLTPVAWQELVSPMALDLVDSWGIDRRNPGSAWFEFREPTRASPRS